MGPLPASIYWRRRVVVLAALAVVIALVAWLVTGSGDEGAQGSKKGSQAPPVQSITPGASPSGSAITSRPGGTGGGTGSVSGSGGGDVSLTTGGTGSGSSGTNGTEGTSGTTGTTGGGSAAGGSTGTGDGQPPVNTSAVMALPVCKASQVSLELASELNAYAAEVRPRLALTVRNTSTSGCRVDLGRTASTLTVTSSAGERVWSSGDCPSARQATWVRLAAGAGLTENFTWDRSRSKPLCATAPTTAAEAGNYLVQADLTGPAGGPVSARTSIRLEG
ncbi:hypothetical protein [Kitasatospora sp. NBC_01539]|uniref:hypothetical protein n=1 Tax=Kitasatospora sp. NBC_01539 TaxID=2903577 RepID=UPI0038602D58